MLLEKLGLEVVVGVGGASHEGIVVETLGAVSCHAELLVRLLLIVVGHLALEHRRVLLRGLL